MRTAALLLGKLHCHTSLENNGVRESWFSDLHTCGLMILGMQKKTPKYRHYM